MTKNKTEVYDFWCPKKDEEALWGEQGCKCLRGKQAWCISLPAFIRFDQMIAKKHPKTHILLKQNVFVHIAPVAFYWNMKFKSNLTKKMSLELRKCRVVVYAGINSSVLASCGWYGKLHVRFFVWRLLICILLLFKTWDNTWQACDLHGKAGRKHIAFVCSCYSKQWHEETSSLE